MKSVSAHHALLALIDVIYCLVLKNRSRDLPVPELTIEALYNLSHHEIVDRHEKLKFALLS